MPISLEGLILSFAIILSLFVTAFFIARKKGVAWGTAFLVLSFGAIFVAAYLKDL